MGSPFEQLERDCHADDIARKQAAAEAARLQAATPPEPEPDQEPGKLRGLFRRRGRLRTATPPHFAGQPLGDGIGGNVKGPDESPVWAVG